MILVIVGHAIQSICEDYTESHIWCLIYSFHMPAFMSVSGWLAYRMGGASFQSECLVSRRFRQLMIPYLVWSIIQYLRHGQLGIENLQRIILYPDAYFWFLWVLFFIYVLFALCQWIARKYDLEDLIVLYATCLLLIGLMVFFEIRLFGFQFIAYYFLFYTIGYTLRKCPIRLFRKPIVLIVLTIIWGILAWGWNMHQLPSWIPPIPNIPISLQQYIYRGVTAAIAIIVILNVAPQWLNGSGLNKVISRFGKVSLGIYVVHLTIMGYITDGIRYIYPMSSTAMVIVVSILTAALSCGIVELLYRSKLSAEVLLGKLQ